MYFVGTLNEPILLAGVGLGNMTINMVAMPFSQGLNGTIESFVSQSFGAKKFEQCGIILNRGKIITTLFLLPGFFLFYFIDSILILLK